MDIIRYNEYYEVRLQDYDIDIYNMTLNGRIYQYSFTIIIFIFGRPFTFRGRGSSWF